jgi:hypothetical protein
MGNNKTFSREEVSKILKIAADLDKATADDKDGLNEEELRHIAEEAGINPEMISKAIFRLEHGEMPVDMSESLQKDYKYKNSFLAEGKTDDKIWEEIVGEIRSIHGGIGKVSRMGSTYEWEQRKQNVGFIQVSVIPKGDRSKVTVNTNYGILSRVYAMIGGLTGFLGGIMIAETLNVAQGDLAVALGSTLVGVILSGFFARNWMKKKSRVLNYLSRRISSVIEENVRLNKAGEIEIEEEAERSSDARHSSSSQIRS